MSAPVVYKFKWKKDKRMKHLWKRGIAAALAAVMAAGMVVSAQAQETPEDYQNLVVRIAGFSAYFVELDRAMQDDFITRTEQTL